MEDSIQSLLVASRSQDLADFQPQQSRAPHSRPAGEVSDY